MEEPIFPVSSSKKAPICGLSEASGMDHTHWLGLLQHHLYPSYINGLPQTGEVLQTEKVEERLLHREEPRCVHHLPLRNNDHFRFVKMFLQCSCLDSL